MCLCRTAGTVVGRRTRHVVVVIELVTAVRSASIVTGRHIISLASPTTSRHDRRRQPQHHATPRPPIMAGPREQPSRGAVPGHRPRAASLPPSSLNRRRLTSARHRRRHSVVTAPAQRRQRPSPRRHRVLMERDHAQKQPPKLPRSRDTVAPPGD